MPCTNHVLVERALFKKDAGAFVELIAKYQRPARAMAFRILGDATAADDVVQDAFGRAWERLSYLREPSQFGTWLCGIVHNLAVDELRHRRIKQMLAVGHAARCHQSVCTPFDQAVHRETCDKVSKAVAGLDRHSRAAVRLRYYENHVPRQIAAAMGITPAAVNMRLFRARKELRVSLVGTR